MGVASSLVLADEWLTGLSVADTDDSANGLPDDVDGRLEAGDLCCSTEEELELLFEESWALG